MPPDFRAFMLRRSRPGAPEERCSRRIVRQLERAGYEVTYREFDGAHTVPLEIALEAAGRLMRSEGE